MPYTPLPGCYSKVISIIFLLFLSLASTSSAHTLPENRIRSFFYIILIVTASQGGISTQHISFFLTLSIDCSSERGLRLPAALWVLGICSAVCSLSLFKNCVSLEWESLLWIQKRLNHLSSRWTRVLQLSIRTGEWIYPLKTFIIILSTPSLLSFLSHLVDDNIAIIRAHGEQLIYLFCVKIEVWR